MLSPTGVCYGDSDYEIKEIKLISSRQVERRSQNVAIVENDVICWLSARMTFH